ncbi:MAG: damage-inducible protein [Betaproteobacteria bacterium RIFCSPLOWO2_02_64_14]|nr:MAG: damage-inducible protein [Betaproteobacteria bacterium RIFCSPLOWO2_02_64_14]
MRELIPRAEKAAALLKARKHTIAVAESSSGGLIAAALLAVPGASAYFKGGAVIYTRHALLGIRDVREDMLAGIRASTEAYALLKARIVRERFIADWGLGESGAAGPTGNRYGDAAGHTVFAVAGALDRSRTLETGHGDRVANMYAFAGAALDLLVEALESK